MNSLLLTDSIVAARTELVVHLADTPALVEQAYRLRHQVYCLERGYEPSVDDLETDAYDKHARHVVLSLRGCGTVIGTVRMILPQARQPTRSFPMQAVCDRATLGAIPLRSAVEVSRFAVSKERRNPACAREGPCAAQPGCWRHALVRRHGADTAPAATVVGHPLRSRRPLGRVSRPASACVLRACWHAGPHEGRATRDLGLRDQRRPVRDQPQARVASRMRL